MNARAKSTARVSASSIRSFLFVAFSIGLERYSWIDVRLRKKCDQLSCQKRSNTTHQPIFQIRCWSNALIFLLIFFGRFQTIGQASRPYFILAFVFRSLFSSVAIWPSLSTQMAPTRKQRKREFKNKTWIKQSERKKPTTNNDVDRISQIDKRPATFWPKICSSVCRCVGNVRKGQPNLISLNFELETIFGMRWLLDREWWWAHISRQGPLFIPRPVPCMHTLRILNCVCVCARVP